MFDGMWDPSKNDPIGCSEWDRIVLTNNDGDMIHQNGSESQLVAFNQLKQRSQGHPENGDEGLMTPDGTSSTMALGKFPKSECIRIYQCQIPLNHIHILLISHSYPIHRICIYTYSIHKLFNRKLILIYKCINPSFLTFAPPFQHEIISPASARIKVGGAFKLRMAPTARSSATPTSKRKRNRWGLGVCGSKVL